ncbi:SDR family NAD(P)-dependent oxidoreductase [Stigmatella sp. ncwal1]|uniref:SDR family NAD(P)-dependent oxidoreductase n=1 Tax=Stigmatella ashevillensis TaxID=2995309 RepID=A0ABT5D4F3_9BACT|nr:SDR family NAD(P)-dependent oxidoreductase [Stigmatella ashevillena]MDC0708552.1 SDR family NAD(P)-dependent oxidoreductase [Stigmatella ashevillena]
MNLDKRQILHQVESGELDIETGVELLSRLMSSGTPASRPEPAAPGPAHEHVYFEACWTAAAAPTERLAPGQRVLVTGEGAASFEALRLALAGHQSVFVTRAAAFRQVASGHYELDPASPGDCAKLMAQLAQEGFSPTHVLHLWQGGASDPIDEPGLRSQLESSVLPVFALVKALLGQVPKHDVFLLSAALGRGGAAACSAVAGFLSVAAQENPRLRGKALHLPTASSAAERTASELLVTELSSGTSADLEVRYSAGQRQLRKLTEFSRPSNTGSKPLRKGGVYLITGGAGGLGLLFARHLVDECGARLVLTGRSPHPSAHQQAALRELEARGGQALYCQANVTSLTDMERVVRTAKEHFGRLSGVIHAAGLIEDAFIIRKEIDSFRRVLAPKAYGALALDQATREEPLDFFVLFSSTATLLGRAGQGDYAAANLFMDEFAATRNALTLQGQRSGHSVSIAWPLWQGGGMTITEEDREALTRLAGMDVLSTEAGLAAFSDALRSNRSHVAVLYGDAPRIRPFVERRTAQRASASSGPSQARGHVEREVLLRGAQEYLLDLLSRETRLPRERIDVSQGLDSIGLDSMLINRLNLVLEDGFGALSKTLFFEYQSIQELAAYFADNHASELATVLRIAPTAASAPSPSGSLLSKTESSSTAAPSTQTQEASAPARDGDIAIIGVSGRYPDAENLPEFWENLSSGRNSVGHVPAERWDLSRYPGLELTARERQGLQWGSFLREVDAFDPLFFNIAPRDAELMDPQERLFLETAWASLEDAGYSRQELHRTCREGDETRVGVFAGVTFGQYQGIGVEEWGKGNYISPGSSYWSIANRLSYVLNLHGPSMPVDTACSSSLTAVHMACESLRRGDCKMAIAGGVNLNIHPAKHVALARLKFLSTEGKCRAFGEGGDGYVPGEGVGAVVLKPLAQARADGDHIYAVIKGSTINHGGKTNGYTVPNPNAQASLISRALQDAHVDARTISYVEAHGTGTSLGDPIELTGLNKAFRAHTRDKQFCALGSVKTNIGHLESAAGIASLTKVLLQFQHQQLAPSLHAETLNRNIDFNSSPFFVQRELGPWKVPSTAASPRRASISSFGAGGANAHLIIEEYVAPRIDEVTSAGTELVLLSAKNPERLRVYAARLKQHLQSQLTSSSAPLSLKDIAFTQQVGREALEERLALVVESVDELVARLADFEEGRAGGALVFTGRVPEDRASKALDVSRTVEFIQRKDWTSLARLWIEGHSVPWGEAFRDQHRHRVPLPSYPFERKRFWVPLSDRSTGMVHTAPSLAPMLDRVVPSLRGAVFEKTFRADERLLRDHHVQGTPVLAGVAQLEMVREAAEAAGGGSEVSVHDVVWLSPVKISPEAGLVRLTLEPREEGASFEMTLPGAAVTCSRGQLRFQDPASVKLPPQVDLQALRARCQRRIGKETLYAGFRSVGIEYGPSFQCVEDLWVQGREALGELRLAPEFLQDSERYALPPPLVDAALHTLQGLLSADAGDGGAQTLIPFSVAELMVYGRLPARCFSYAQLSESNPASGVARFNVAILDESGRCLVVIKDFTARRLRPVQETPPAPTSTPTPTSELGILYQPRWKPQPLASSGRAPRPEGRTVLIFTHANDCGLGDALAELHGTHRTVRVGLGDMWSDEGPNRRGIDQRNPQHYGRVLAEIGDLSAVYFLGGMQSKRYSSHDLRQLDRMEERGVFSLLRLTRLLAERPPSGLQLKVVTNDVHHVRDGDTAHNPFAAALVGFTKVLSREFSQLRVTCIDVASAELSEGGSSAEAVLHALAEEPGETAGLQWALREGRRFVQTLEAVELPEPLAPTLPLIERGVYLILGGAGGLGLTVSEHLARKYRARLILVGRSPLREDIQQRIQAIEALGAEVLYLQADLSDLDSMRGVVREARHRFGAISGVIHSAIVLRDGIIGRMTEEQLRSALAPKTRGMVILNHVLEAEPVDFLAFFSSAISFTGAAGQANYAAASTFEDSFALYLDQRMKRPVRIFNWGFWGEVGVVATDDYRERMARRGVGALSREEGLHIFERVMAGRATQIFPLKLQPELLEFFKMDPTHPRAPLPETFPSVLSQVNARLEGFIGQGPDIPGNEALLPIEQHGRLLLLRAFQEMGVMRTPGERYPQEALRERLQIQPSYARLYEAMLDILSKAGFVKLSGGFIEVMPAVSTSSAQTSPEHLRAHQDSVLARLPDGRAFITLLEACVTSLPQVLTGRKTHLEVMFPGGSKALVENIYKGNRRSDYFNELVCQGVLSVLEKRLADSPGQKIALLEIGSGTGGTSGRVFEAIQAHGPRLSYDYTDISKGFVTHGQRTFGSRYPFASFKVLDVEKDVTAQGFQPGTYDIILATNVLHATRDIRNTLHHAKLLLKTNGVILINEVTQVQDFTTLTFGLTSGWWLYEDAPVRLPHSPLLGLREWRSVLEDLGFRRVTGFGLPRGRPAWDGQNVILAESDGWIDAALRPAPSKPSTPSMEQQRPTPEAPRFNTEDLRERTLLFLRNTLADVLKMDPSEFEPGATFETYGVDSLVGMDFLDKLGGDFPSLPKTLLFEHITLAQLTTHFLQKFPEVLRSKLGGAPKEERQVRTEGARTSPPSASAPRDTAPRNTAPIVDAASLFGGAPQESAPPPAALREEPPARREDGIAIIGVSGRYPMAEDLRAFWTNLREGRSAFTEVPPDRWSQDAYHDASGERPGTTYHRWGAFLSDVDKFDPLFFGISPREAQLMDPQERLFLQTAWATMEDACWTSEQLNRYAHSSGGQGVGVFVGVMYGPYQLLAAEEWARGNRVDAQSAYWSIANRVSYSLDFRGPSMAIDTACSSSLTAIHLACESIRRGECRAALAGGVNLILHPSHHVGLGKMSMLSRNGTCRAFGEGADGFVPGEGVGCILLKPLADAIRDGDHIYGVIRGSAVNTNGKTSGYTVPSPNAQADLIESALKRSGVDPRTLSYVEAQAVGSALADPIEVVGLTKAFERFTGEQGFCAIGSVKPNVGHLEAASGMAQLTKLLLQLQYGQLAPSLGADRLNPYIDFDHSPFRVQRQGGAWPEPRDSVTGQRQPRRAAVSSFGAGGANAHLIIEEHVSLAERTAAREEKLPQLVVLSARKPERLAEQVQRLHSFLSDTLSASRVDFTLADVAYSLQTGREAMNVRLAVIASDLRSLLESLSHFLSGRTASPRVLTGTVKKSARPAPLSAETVRQARVSGRLESIASAWVEGAEVDWTLLHPDSRQQRLSLPSYPFAKERYWLESTAPIATQSAEAPTTEVPLQEPLPISPTKEATVHARHEDPRAADDRALLKKVQDCLIQGISEILNVRAADVDLDEHLSGYGFDSISLTKFTAYVNRQLGLDISPAIFFEHSTVNSFADYLVNERREALVGALLNTAQSLSPPPARPSAETQHRSAQTSPAAELPPSETRIAEVRPPTSEANRTAEPIAVIGMAGRFPGSPDLGRYWENLLAGKDLITEIPSDRFDWKDIYGDPQKDPSKTPSKWGGFLQDVDRFDALFFSISPREARTMDPQQRLFLETVWQTLEDAGYSPSQLAGTSTGLFVGVAGSEYSHLLAQSGVEIDGQAATGNAHSILANRISFLMDLHGPSEPVDTACSSSLVAVHRAVQSIQAGECDMAIAGGVNVLLTPVGFLAFGKSGMLASDGRCKTFDQRADGYVRGEGVGAVLLKPLSRAVADGDTVYGIIKGTAVNHGGRANSLTAPNPNAQADLIVRAMRRAGVAPETMGYIEAHGTGTALGDPIEVNGLKRAFRELGLSGADWNRKSCGLGTVKTNIGHLETAAGIAGLIKLLLSLRSKQLPPLVHFQKLNEYIQLEDSPFYIVERAQDWQPARDARGTALPRRAGISSFGFGGVNVHVVLEEHVSSPSSEEPESSGEAIVLSARSPEQLKVYAEDLVAFLERDAASQAPAPTRMADMAYTLQVGREAMSHRLALIVRNRRELAEKLQAFVRGEAPGTDVFTGEDRAHKDVVSLFSADGEDQGYFQEQARRGNFRKLAALWAKGFPIDWASLMPRASRKRVSLPTSPFARERHWLPPPAVKASAPAPRQEAAPTPPPPVAARPAPTLTVVSVPTPSTPPPSEARPIAEPIQPGQERAPGPRERIRNIFAEYIGVEAGAVDPVREFTSYGIDSIAGLRIMQRIQQLYGEEVPMLAIIEHPTLNRFTDHLLQNYVKDEAPAAVQAAPPLAKPHAISPSAEPPRPAASPQRETASPQPPVRSASAPEVRLVPFQPQGAETPLIALPGSWGDVGWLIEFLPHLGTAQPVLGLELDRTPTQGGIECSVEVLAKACVKALLAARPSGPYRLAASGLGSSTALEVARQLQELGHEVSELLLIAASGPGPVREDALMRQVGDSAYVLTCLGNALGQMWKASDALRYDTLPAGDLSAQRQGLVRFLTTKTECPIPSSKLEPWLDGASRQYAFGLMALGRYQPRPLSRPLQALWISPKALETGPTSAYRLPSSPVEGTGTASDWQTLLGVAPRAFEAPYDRFELLSGKGLAWVKEKVLTPQPAAVRPAASPPPRSIIVPINKNGAQRPSFWVHTLLGDVSYGLNLSHHMGIDSPLFGIEQFDMDGNIFLLPTIEEMASRYIDSLRTAQPEGPYVLGGYSFGGIVAFEMAYQLNQRGEEVSNLVLIDSLMPGTEVFSSIDTSAIQTDDFSIMALILIGNSFGNRWHADRHILIDDIAGHDRAKQLERVARHLKDHSKTEFSFEELLELVRGNYQTITSNNDALNRYRPKGPLGPQVNAMLFHATLGFVGPNNPNNIPEVKIRVSDRTNGFGRYISNGIRIIDLPADHYTICTEEFIKVVAEKTRVATVPMHVIPTERAS